MSTNTAAVDRGSAEELALPDEHVVVFTLAETDFAIGIHTIQEIVRMQPITRVPGANDWVEGLTNLRGRVTPVVDLRRRCGLPMCDESPEMRIIVVNHQSGQVGLIVDSVSEVLRIASGNLTRPAELTSGTANEYIRVTGNLDGRLISILDVESLLDFGWSGASALLAQAA